MSIRVMTAVWDIALPDSEKIVLLALADCANDEGYCWPSMATLAKKCSKSDRTVQASIKSLAEAGHLTRSEVPGKGCSYVVHPRSVFTPEAYSPPKPLRKTPEKVAGDPRSGFGQTVIEPSGNVNDMSADADAPPVLKPEHVIEAWNDLADRKGLAKVRVLTPERKRKLASRIRQSTLDDWTEAIGAIERSPFLLGQNERGWRADFDFLLQPKSFTKLIEGSYDRTN